MDLKAKRDDVVMFSVGPFFWSWMLESGVGLPVCVGKGIDPTSFVYKPRPDGKCLYYNDGAEVTEEEANSMAMVADWVANYQDTLNDVWMRMSEDEQSLVLEGPTGLHNKPVRSDWVKALRDFAEWARVSGGFYVY